VICPSCGHHVPNENQFCGHCGTRLRNGNCTAETVGVPVADHRKITAAGPLPLFQSRNTASVHRGEPDTSTTALSVASPESAEVGQKQSEPAEQAVKPGMEDSYQSSVISGPSLLGLGGTAPYGSDEASATSDEPSSDLSYLYDEPRRAIGWRVFAALILLVSFGVFLTYVWRQYPSWHSSIIKSLDEVRTKAGHIANGNPQTGSANEAESARSGTQISNSSQNSGLSSGNGGQEKAVLPQNSGPELSASPVAHTPEPQGSNSPAAVPEGGRGVGDGKSPDANPPTAAQPVQPQQSAAGARQEDKAPPALELHPKPLNADQDASPAVAESPKRTPVASVEAANPGEAQYIQGLAYLEGRGAPHDCNQALALLKAAAAKGNPQAASQLGALYATGHCVSMDRPTAYRWFSSALAERHNSLVEYNRQMLWSQMSEAERLQARATR
jgi:hypothetical protein